MKRWTLLLIFLLSLALSNTAFPPIKLGPIQTGPTQMIPLAHAAAIALDNSCVGNYTGLGYGPAACFFSHAANVMIVVATQWRGGSGNLYAYANGTSMTLLSWVNNVGKARLNYLYVTSAGVADITVITDVGTTEIAFVAASFVNVKSTASFEGTTTNSGVTYADSFTSTVNIGAGSDNRMILHFAGDFGPAGTGAGSLTSLGPGQTNIAEVSAYYYYEPTYAELSYELSSGAQTMTATINLPTYYDENKWTAITTALLWDTEDYSMSNSGAVSLVAGYSSTTTITVTNILYTPTVSLTCTSGLPSGASCGFNPSPGVATFDSTLTISTTSITVGGAYSVTVTGTSGLGIVRTTAVTLYIFDFSLNQVVNVNVYQGQTSTYTNWVTATKLQGPATNVAFTLTNLPSDVSYSFTPSGCSATCSLTLEVSADDSVTAGSYGITLVGAGGNQTHTKSFSLIVITPTVTVTVTTTSTSTSSATSSTIISTTITTTTTSQSTIPVGTTTQTLISYTATDIPLVLYGLAAFLVLTPSMVVVLITKSVPGLLIGFVSGIIWAIVSGVLPITALLLMIGVAIVAIIFRARG